MTANTSLQKPKLRLEMLSDWHVGTGAGIPGSIDALLARDADEFPCVPAKTIVGIWRDALETLTLGLDGGPDKPKMWQKWVGVIFGSQPNIDKVPTDKPRLSILSIRPARLAQDLRCAIGNDQRLRQALTIVKPNTAIDSDSGTAKAESLRFTEIGRIGTVLESAFKLDFNLLESAPNEQIELIEALLVTSASMVERIGGNRRRGSGKCEWQIDGLLTKAEAVNIIRNYSPKQSVTDTPSLKQQNNTGEAPQMAGGDKWRKIPYTLKLRTPVAIVTNTLGNVSETLDFIPGTYLLPHITKQLKGISKCVAASDFQISPATIEVNGERSLPVPRIFLQQKMDESKVYNRLEETEESLNTKPQVTPLRGGFVIVKNGSFTHVKTPIVLLMHNTVKDEIQRPDETVGGVFSRQAIKAGTTLRGEIRFKKSIEDQVKTLGNYESDVRLGTSRKDDYGLAAVRLQKSADEKSEASVISNKLIVYLESDVLLRNASLRQTSLVDDLRAELEKTFGKDALTEGYSLIQIRRIESWHEGWGFPRPTLMAMAAGSVAVFAINDYETLTEEQSGAFKTKLGQLELSGIGERRGEGYGRIRFNPPLLTSPIISWTAPTKSKPAVNGNSQALSILKAEINNAEKLKEFVSFIELSAWRNELARAVLKLANEPKRRNEIFGFDSAEKVPPMSQIGGLRSAIRRLEKPKDQNVIGWLEHLEATSNRLERWDRNKDREKARRKVEKIKKLVNDQEEVWRLLKQKDFSGRPYWILSNEFVTPHKAIEYTLWTEAVKSLFDACARAHKRDTED